MAYPKTDKEYLKKLILAAEIPNYYNQPYPYNCGYFDGSATSWDCVNLNKTILNGWEYSDVKGSFCNDFSRTGDVTEYGLLMQCEVSTDFSKLDCLATLYMDGHIGNALGYEVEKNGHVYNAIECTGSWGGGVLYSYVDSKGRRYNHKNGSQNGRWTHWGKMTKWLKYEKFTGWKKVKGKWYYYKEEIPQVGWLKNDGKWYYLSKPYGQMLTGWQKINDKWYLFADGDSGRMLTGWQKWKNHWYYLNDKGVMQTGWKKINGQWYYLRDGDSGRMVTGWLHLGNNWYFLDDTGAMHEGWLNWKKNKYYLMPKTGIMATGTQTIDGKEYHFNSKGALIN